MMIDKGQDPLVNTDKFELDPEKGVINIGSDAENDIVIQHPSIRPFHMMLAYGEKPYQIIPLDPDAEISIRGIPIRADGAIPVNDLNDVRFGSFSFTSVPPNGGDPKAESFSIIPVAENEAEATDSDSIQAPLMFSTQDVSAPVFLTPNTPFAPGETEKEVMDEVILVELAEKEQSIEVEQTATYHLNIINGGPIVAAFDVAVEGVPAEWLTIQPPRVNLFEGGKAAVTVTITPPRRPTSRAGLHSLRFTVTSANHAGRKTVKLANLTIAPYYDFSLSEVNPIRLVIPFRKRYGEVEMEVRNRGNCPAHLNLMAQDDGNECQFSFLAPNGLMQLSQVEYTVPAGETQLAPIHISPIKRSFFRLSAKQHPYRVSVSQPENESLSLFTTGTALARPLLGILELLLVLAVLVGVTFFLFTPRIISFEADDSVIGLGESTTLHWDAFIFTHNLSISGIEDPIKSSEGDIEIFPSETVNTYQLTASTWLWKMLNLEPMQRTFTVLAVPSEPTISTFMINDSDVMVGDYDLMRWSVSDASKVLLTINGVTDVFEDPKDFNGERNLFIDSDTLVSIEAVNSLGSTVESKYILASPPTIKIKKFEVDKTSVFKGEQVTIIWDIEGTGMEDGGEVKISAFESALPLKGELTFFPEESMEFVLTVTNREAKEVRILPVGVLDPQAAPVAPTINFFTAAPQKLVGPGEVELAWSVTGMFQNISITNGKETIATGLSAQGFRTIKVASSGTYVISAVNQDQSAGKELTITVDPALLTAKLSVTSISRTENLTLGDKVVVSVACNSPKDTDPPPTGTVVVSDGTASCSITLPVTSCELEFLTPGNKLVTATYMGDSKYVQSKSAAFTPAFNVVGNTMTLIPSFKPSTGPFYFGQKVDLKVTAQGSNPLAESLGKITIKRICDSTAHYLTECAATSTSYQLTSADGGMHIFKDLVVNQLGGNFEIQVIYSGDSFYTDTYQTIKMQVDGNILSPLNFSTTTDLSQPFNVGSIPLSITVTDQNTSALYSTPKGTVEVTALHSDGTTRIACNPSSAGLTRIDDQTARATCTITPAKIGLWTLSATFTPVEDIWHTSESGQIGVINAVSPVVINMISPPTSMVTLADTTLDVDLWQYDGITPVINGSLACSATSGLESCTCTYDETNFDWDCKVRPNLTTDLPATRSITFAYTPLAGSFLNTANNTRSFSIIKADTIANRLSPVSLEDHYIVDDVLPVTIVANHVMAGGVNPITGANKVTIQIGTNICQADTGMTGYLVSYSADLGVAKNIILDKTLNTGSNMHLCYQYKGDTAYNASSWVSSSSFLVRNAVSNITVTAQPDAVSDPLIIGNNANITVTVTNTDGGVNPISGNVNFQLGTGICDSANGMTSGLIGTIADVDLGGDNDASTSVLLKSDHAVGQDIHFCVRYAGLGKNAASNWVASNDFRVKAQPSFAATNPVSVVLSPLMDDFTEFTVTVNDAVSPGSASVSLVDAGSNTICPALTTHHKCEFVSQTGGAYTFKIASDLPGVIALTPKFVGDEKNLASAGTAFNVDARYEIVWGGLNINPSTFNTYSSYENIAEDMNTDITTTFNIRNYATFDETAFNLTPAIVKVISSTDSGTISTDIDGCSSSPLTDFSVSCIDTQVNDPTVEALKVTLVPSTATADNYFTDTLTSGFTSTDITANILETTTGSTYDPTIRCTAASDDSIVITGYTEIKEEGTASFAGGEYFVILDCEYGSVPAGTQHRCYVFENRSDMTPAQIVSGMSDCSSNLTGSYDGTASLSIDWETMTPNKFLLTVANAGFTGCPVIKVSGTEYQNSNAKLFYEFTTGDSEYESFSTQYTVSGANYCQ